MRSIVEAKGKGLETGLSAEFLDSKSWTCCLNVAIPSEYPGTWELKWVCRPLWKA